MKVNHLSIPDELCRPLQAKLLLRDRGSWPLLRKVDCFGNAMETELGLIYQSAEEMAKATASLSLDFVPDGTYGEQLEEQTPPGAIPDVISFENAVCFGIAGDGSPFCLDFREPGEAPSVIWWDDTVWRKVAPDIRSFLALFGL